MIHWPLSISYIISDVGQRMLSDMLSCVLYHSASLVDLVVEQIIIKIIPNLFL